MKPKTKVFQVCGKYGKYSSFQKCGNFENHFEAMEYFLEKKFKNGRIKTWQEALACVMTVRVKRISEKKWRVGLDVWKGLKDSEVTKTKRIHE